jgi:DnaJ-class molecular chaperone
VFDYDSWLESGYTTESNRTMDCPDCDGNGSDDADFDHDLGKFVPYGVCERCNGDGWVEREEE